MNKNEHQVGFRKEISTDAAINILKDKVTVAFNTRDHSASSLYYYTKALDC